jgi:hypothetical protein
MGSWGERLLLGERLLMGGMGGMDRDGEVLSRRIGGDGFGVS